MTAFPSVTGAAMETSQSGLADTACGFPNVDEFDQRVPHGDPFPLPRLGRPGDSEALARRVDAAVGAVSTLASAVFDKNLLDLGLQLTHVQK